MKSCTSLARLFAGLFISPFLLPLVLSEVPKEPRDSHPATLKAWSINYKPRVIGAPIVRASGIIRGDKDHHLPDLYVLAPEHEAYTMQAQPALFWYQSDNSTAEFELTLIDPRKPRPLLTLKGSGEQTAGIHRITLAKKNITLEPGVSYRWSVALVPDPKSRSKDVIATGQIKRIEAPGDLAAKAEKASLLERAQMFAEAGCWYDALQALSMAIDAEPLNASLHHLRASLLEQGKLADAAAAEEKRAR